MINKISAVVATILILGSVSIASAATTHKVARHYFQAPRAAVAPANFQSSWDVSY